jgi:Ca2+-binding RTX toxin-like protein
VIGVRRQLAFLVVGLVAVLVLAGQLARAAAGPSPGDPQDESPFWASDGVGLAFQRQVVGASHILFTTSSGKGGVTLAPSSGTLRGYVPGTMHLLVGIDAGQTLVLTGGRYDGPVTALRGADATASPDGRRVAYLRDGALYVAAIDGSGERAVASDVSPPSWDLAGPVWSPDSTRITIASGSSLLLVQADGGGSRTLFSGDNQSVNPSWSPDGGTIAFERNAAAFWQIWVVHPDGTGARELIGGSSNDRYPQFSPVSDTLAFISDRQHARGGATQYQFALYTQALSDTVAHKLVDDVHPYSPARWSPTAALIAVSAGHECRRWGIYVVRSNVGSVPHRRSNVCRYTGTPAADTIHGSNSFDIINGLGGDDTIYGLDGNDKISANAGDDTILGQNGNDFILAGPGDDRVFGGPGNDTIIGGNGVDRIDCGPGNDTVDAAGPRDLIARNCEHIHRT